MDIQDAQGIVNTHAGNLEVFVLKYLCNDGIVAQIIEAVAQELQATQSQTPIDIVYIALSEITSIIGVFGDNAYSIKTVIEGAASLELLVRYARKLDSRVMPPGIIPPQEIVDAVLVLFHAKKAQVVASA